MQPGIGFPPDSQVGLLRKLVWNTWYIATYGGGGGGGNIRYVSPPATPASPGSEGDVAEDGSYFYVYSTAAGAWRRTSIDEWS